LTYFDFPSLACIHHQFVSTLGPRAEAVRLAGDGIDLKSAKLGRSQFNIGFLDLESASKGHQTRK
jgi:hypothetical protein